ncbi:unnamed protein product [Boreogadus saida]
MEPKKVERIKPARIQPARCIQNEEDVMSPTVTHVVAEATNAFHSKELQDMLLQYPQAVATQTAWLDTCYSRQTRVDATPFLHAFR